MRPVQLLAPGMSGMGRGYPCAGPRQLGPPTPICRQTKPHKCRWPGQAWKPQHQLPHGSGAGSCQQSQEQDKATSLSRGAALKALDTPAQQGCLCPSVGGPGQPPKSLHHGPVLGRGWMHVGNGLSVKPRQRLLASLGTPHQHPTLPA